MGLKVGTVRLENYNPAWKKEFELEKEKLKTLFKDVAITIEHIGSTSVEGLSAKPIIDIAVGVKNFDDFEKVRSNFKEPTYSVREENSEDEILIRKGLEEDRTHFIHVMEINSDRYKNSIMFRDYLRKHKDVAKEYQKLKEELAIKYANDRKTYTSSKNDFIQEVLRKAREEVKNGNLLG